MVLNVEAVSIWTGLFSSVVEAKKKHYLSNALKNMQTFFYEFVPPLSKRPNLGYWVRDWGYVLGATGCVIGKMQVLHLQLDTVCFTADKEIFLA